MRVLLTGGGTSGHVNPALAIAEIIKKHEPSSTFAYVGTEKGIERGLVEKEFYPFYTVNIQGIKRSLSPSNIKTAFLILTAPAKAKKIVKEFKPDVVIGTGGYVCWAPLKVAAEMGIPTVIHESNSVAGLAVRKLEKKVDLILTNFEETANSLNEKQKIVRVGNPTRSSFGECDKEASRERLGIEKNAFVVLSFGGSLGAPAINRAALDVMEGFSSKHDDVVHFHSGGRLYCDEAKDEFAKRGLANNKRLDVREYIFDMSEYMNAADLVICRAGAMTLTELAKMKKPAILIPSPNVTDQHQYKNALALSSKDAAVLIQESELNSENVIAKVKALYESADMRKKMSDAIGAFDNTDTDEKIYAEISKLVKSRAKISLR